MEKQKIKWTKVSDALPEEDGFYTGYDKYDGLVRVYFKRHPENYMFMYEIRDDNGIMGSFDMTSTITHWAPDIEAPEISDT